ncbi:hypothetical protein FOXG_21831 [Fusarium oxysporum f. sp. lycopersici 4287]|uniref:Arrestin C-terminal-like domain-containing protein n=1 Tax=Fusarium oxysporum f. sp. lycopersici (strain 4287 / CBS 123668 / FGSC 9935 / NRRL 34936) TaxID=426428 RepID=A0A0J9W1C1_FUSO4|nr:hypothetical protein FOXG_21831 [Fusarium oxysporum f. sp. lycopersici 4287]KNB16919.1 hypothetical protein FOXG_21831 [Fusarium oxysporum f. sp. lycopersici 4287]
MKELDSALYTIAWIAPLEIEATAALHMLDNCHEGRFPMSRGDDYVFLAGDVNGHNIIIATLPAGQEYGTGSAAALASQIKKFFPNLWFGLLVGVAAGLPNLTKIPPIDIRLGDVLVGLPDGQSAGLVAYDLGKETPDGFQLLRVGRALATTETVVRSAIGNIRMMAPNDTDIFLPFYDRIKDKEHRTGVFTDPGQEQDIFYEFNNEGVQRPVQRQLRHISRRTRVWYGSIGSGDKLTKHSRRRDELRDQYGIIGLEMEAAGTVNRIPVGVIRGVCDYADEHKNKEWQPYAAAMAAAYARAVLREIGPGKAVPAQGEGNQEPCGAILCDLPPNTDRFFGREKELSDMVSCLELSNQRKGAVLCGISGSGKTQLAREYVSKRGERFSAILWIDASSEESIDQSMLVCASRICEEIPDFRTGRENTLSHQFVSDWLRTTSHSNWLVVIDNANGPIPNRRLLGPFQDMQHGALCVISTHRVTAGALRLREVFVERLDPLASQSLVLWRAYQGHGEPGNEARNAARLAAKPLDGFPLALELAGVLHQRGIVSLDKFPTSFSHDYTDLAQYEIDSGVWIWTRIGAMDSLFSMLDALYASAIAKSKESALLITYCSIYGPLMIPISLLQNMALYEMENIGRTASWEQLQALVRSDIKLNKAIDELGKVFLATKQQGADCTILGFSLHASICQWRFATMNDRDLWIVQASYSLSRHIQSLNGMDAIHRFFNVFHRCLDTIWKYIDQCHLDPIHGKFAKPYFTICSCGADVYLSMGKSDLAKTLFTAAIDYVHTSEPAEISEKSLLRLLSGLAKSCENTRDFETAEEALISATEISERVNGHIHDETADLVSRLKSVREYISVDLENRKRVLVASTGPKLPPTLNLASDSPSQEVQRHFRVPESWTRGSASAPSSSISDLSKNLLPSLNLSWEICLEAPMVVLSRPREGEDDPSTSTMRGRLRILAHESVEIRAISLQLDGRGSTTWKKGELRDESAYSNVFYRKSWYLMIFNAQTATRDVPYGDNCTYQLDSEISSNGTPLQNVSPTNEDIISRSAFSSPQSYLQTRNMDTAPDYVVFPPGRYDYSFEITLNSMWVHTIDSVHGNITWTLFASIVLSNNRPDVLLRKNFPIILVPYSLVARTESPRRISRKFMDDLYLHIELPYDMCVIGRKLPITVTLDLLQSDLRVEYLSYSIVQRGARWTKDRATHKRSENIIVLLEKISKGTEPTLKRDDSPDHQETDARPFPTDMSDDGIQSWQGIEEDLPNVTHREPTIIAAELVLPTCKQIEAEYSLDQEPLEPSCRTAFIQVNHDIQITVGLSRSDPNQGGSHVKWEVLEEIPITIIDCRITYMSNRFLDRMDGGTIPNQTTNKICGCPDADSFDELMSTDHRQLPRQICMYLRKHYGQDEDEVRVHEKKLDELWEDTVPNLSKSKDWEVFQDDDSADSFVSDSSANTINWALPRSERRTLSLGDEAQRNRHDELPPYGN